MNFRKTFLVFALAVSFAANASIVTIVDAVETVTSNMSVPTSGSGRLMFRPCAETCDEKFIIVRLTDSTAYFVKNQQVDFLEFRRQFFNMRRGSDDYALVSYDTESNTVSRVNIGH